MDWSCYLTRNVHFRRDTPEGMMVSALENEPLSLTNVGLPMKILFVPVHVREPGKFSRYPDYTPSDAVITCPLSNKTIEIRGIHRGDDEGSMRMVFHVRIASTPFCYGGSFLGSLSPARTGAGKSATRMRLSRSSATTNPGYPSSRWSGPWTARRPKGERVGFKQRR